MKLKIRDASAKAQTDPWPTSSGPLISRSFGLSLCVHGAVLAMVIIAAGQTTARPLSLYDQEIRPFESKLIWYNLKTKTPDVAPTRAPKTPRPPRAVRKLDQNLISGLKEDQHPAQKVWIPDAPKVELPKVKDEPLPNLLAVAPEPKPALRKFQAPPQQAPKPKPVQALPDAPEVALKLNAEALPKDFSLETRIPRRSFAPPPPAKAAVKTAAPELPPAPESQMQNTAVNAATMAIVGLDPAKSMEIPKPPPPREANFSAGPKPNPNGESTPASKAVVTVPGLYASGGPKDARATLTAGLAPLSQRNLMATLRTAGGAPHATAGGPHAPRVSSSPDPRMDGRAVYMMAIQMQNITSYSGSWMVWFAESRPLPGAAPVEMRPPDPRRKVDPKYNTDAQQERVEGIVRLSAVIRKDGHVDTVELLKHLDDRLDKDAEEALAKWQFEPAQRDGEPVEVDAVFEIPFRLAPRATK